ncbi:hypothetical protein [Streptomyces ehimensis]|uniref:4Fe-4S Wbl-type domain-containing protein n=1 Tax=Streptomyces ehimensis TaxID=68195 RepID=A0ABV9BE58_9ACTN
MIDKQRILALAQQSRPRVEASERAVDHLLALRLLHSQDSPLARPIAWSAALCGSRGELDSVAREEAARVCVACPISEPCRTAIVTGMPESARAWRERRGGDLSLTV